MTIEKSPVFKNKEKNANYRVGIGK